MNPTRRPRSTTPRIAAGIFVVAALATGCVTLEERERELTFRPIREIATWYSGTPDAVQEFFLPVGSGATAQRMHAWWWPDDNPAAPAVFYLHGARQNLTGHLQRIAQLRGFGFSVFAIDYRGFGRSDGDLPSESTVYEDARAGWAWFAKQVPDASRRIIYGHSIGGAVAIDLAAAMANGGGAARGMIVESSFTSLPEMATEVSKGWLPVALMSQKFDSIAKIPAIHMPVLIVHGASDRFVPARFSEALFAAAPAPKKLLLVASASHNNSLLVGTDDYHRAMVDLFGLDASPRNGVRTVAPSPVAAVGAKG